MEKGVDKWKQEKYENLLYSFCDKPSVSLAQARTKSSPSVNPYSLDIQTLPNHAEQLYTAPHHRVQPP